MKKQEAVKQEAVKQEAVKQEVANQEVVKQEAVKQEAVKQESADEEQDKEQKPSVSELETESGAGIKKEPGEEASSTGQEAARILFKKRRPKGIRSK
ncbi:hypothetical protein CDD82_6236 [Ophiocordyceps australis]|uniref:Uncharacterized protein n=1 Tax=Ophiocordyceps australis TaxID=1399860 RepID=A0A2C5Y1I5_9HYPO|nr:hypothetical protein CDD82_6236 [Ophiocordyceps australis]